MPVFPDAYLYDTRHLSLEEHGAYWLLLMAAWRMPDCALPDDDVRLARILAISAKKWARLKPVVMGFWQLDDGRWTQKRLLQERRYVEHKREVNTSAAEARWNGQDDENKGEEESERISGRNSERKSARNAPQPLPLNKDKGKPLSGKHVLPENWEPEPFGEDSESREIVDGWSEKELKAQLEAFRAHHEANGSKFTDWQKAWSTWALNSRRFAPRSKIEKAGHASTGDAFLDAMAADYLPKGDNHG